MKKYSHPGVPYNLHKLYDGVQHGFTHNITTVGGAIIITI